MSTDKTGREQSRDDDARVSAAYRETATGSTPEHLDKLVLGSAARAARPRLGRMRRWTRPLAWAATIALSVAIVLEVSRSPWPDGVPETPALELMRIDEPSAAKAGATGAAMPAVAADEAGVSPQPVAAPDALLSRQRASERPEAAPATGADAEAERAEAPLTTEQDMALGESAATPPVAARKMALPATTGLREEATEPAACDADARSTAENWLACIEQLEKSGQAAAAARERELFVAAFPDFLPH